MTFLSCLVFYLLRFVLSVVLVVEVVCRVGPPLLVVIVADVVC